MTMRETPRRKKARGLLLRHGYAVGGHVKAAIADAVHKHERHDPKGATPTRLKRGGGADGALPPVRADKPRRAAGGHAKKAGTKIIILNNHPQPVPVPRPVPVPMRAPAPMPGAAPMLPPGPAPRPPMARRGGRI